MAGERYDAKIAKITEAAIMIGVDIEHAPMQLVGFVFGTQVKSAAAGDFAAIAVMVGRDAAPADRSDIVRATPLWQQLIQLVETHQPKLVILDTLSDLFAGNENSRPQARQFISMLRGVALKHDLAFVVLSHPSLTGLAAGTGSSGSTGWNNSVRSRLYLNRVLTEIHGEKGKLIETDPDLRALITTKTNYGRKGDEVRLRWSNGVFVALDQAASGAIASLTKEADTRAAGGALVLRMISRRIEMASVVSSRANSWTSSTAFGRPPGLPDRPF